MPRFFRGKQKGILSRIKERKIRNRNKVLRAALEEADKATKEQIEYEQDVRSRKIKPDMKITRFVVKDGKLVPVQNASFEYWETTRREMARDLAKHVPLRKIRSEARKKHPRIKFDGEQGRTTVYGSSVGDLYNTIRDRERRAKEAIRKRNKRRK